MGKYDQDRSVNTKDIGGMAENFVTGRLKGLGYDIIERNFLCKVGEIDIIAVHRDELVFVEVRSRQWAESLNPIYAISRKKINSLKRTAQVYLTKNQVTRPYRFDFAIVTLKPEPVMEILENAIFEYPFR